MEILNFPLLKQPLNWVIILLMVDHRRNRAASNSRFLRDHTGYQKTVGILRLITVRC